MNRHLFACVLTSIVVAAAGCASPTDEESSASSGDALSDAPSHDPQGPAPIVFEVQPPPPQLKLNLDIDWTKADVDVLDRIDTTPAWIKAQKDDQPSFVSTIRDQVENGVGTGNCRVKVGLKKAIVGCSWHF